MGTITLTLPSSGQVVTAGLHTNNYTALQTLLNGNLDNNNFGAGKIFDPAKLMQNAATSLQVLAWDTGTATWKPTTLGGGFTTLADVTLAAPNATLDSGVFSTSGYNHLRVFAALQDSGAGTSLNTVMRLNNDSTAQYYWGSVVANNSVLAGGPVSTGTGITIGDHPGAGANTVWGDATIDIPFASTVRKHNLTAQSFNVADGTSPNTIFRNVGATYNVSAAISRVQFLAGTTFVVGSRIIVLGY